MTGGNGWIVRARSGVAAWLLAAAPVVLHAQEGQERDALRVFLDCSDFICDDDYFRRAVPFVNYVRDREDSDVHVLIISQETGAGGNSITLDFIGRGEFAGMEDRNVVSIPPDTPEAEELERISRGIGAGLIRYVARTDILERIRIEYEEIEGRQAVASLQDDPWDFWVFQVSMSGGIEAEDRQDEISLEARLSANRVTDALKIETSVDGEYTEENFDVNDSTTVTSLDRNYELETLAVWSIGDHWSAGGTTSLEHSTFSNRELAIRVAPALEYNLFRYEESERKQFTILYTLGLNRFNWREETLLGKTSETRVDQSLRASASVRQPWGEVGGDLQLSHYIDDVDANRISGGAFIDLRITRGLSLDLRAEASRVRDQINLPVGDATPEEILLELRELQTGFEYDFSIGFSYRFGSIFNNVVNPRFDSGFNNFF